MMKRGKATAVLDRCACGWQLGANLSGDCGACNEVIARMPGRDRCRKRQSSPADAEPESVGEAPQADFKAPQVSKKHTHLQAKEQADANVAQNGFVRAFVTENGHKQASLTHAEWYQSFVPRDGHCLMHCFVQILQQREAGHRINNQSQMREAIAQYFEAHENNLEVAEFKDDFGSFQCESIECIRAGCDSSGECRHYGGIAECVAFSYRFGISLDIHAPESMYGSFKCNGGGILDHAPEALMMMFGWHGNQRRRGRDHWQRMIKIESTISVQDSLVPNDNCVVMDECMNLQKDVQEVKSAKKESDEAAKKCNPNCAARIHTRNSWSSATRSN
jgi:hypothetical protein